MWEKLYLTKYVAEMKDYFSDLSFQAMNILADIISDLNNW